MPVSVNGSSEGRGALNVPPPPVVLEAFGATGQPLPLAGGQQTVWRVGDAVLKRTDSNLAALEWRASVLERLDGQPAFRVAPPFRTGDGRLTTAGWTAWRYEPGEHLPRPWPTSLRPGTPFTWPRRIPPNHPLCGYVRTTGLGPIGWRGATRPQRRSIASAATEMPYPPGPASDCGVLTLFRPPLAIGTCISVPSLLPKIYRG